MTKPKLKIQELNIQEIQIKSLNKSEFCVKEDYEDFQKLFKKSFSDYKQIEPIVLMRDGEIYYIIQGLNRYKAMKAQGIESIQAFVYEDISKDEAKCMRIDSKIVRKKETIFEKAKLYRDRREMFQKDQRNYFADNLENIDISSLLTEHDKLSGYTTRYIQMLIKIDRDIHESTKAIILKSESDLKYKITPLIELSRIENEEEQLKKAQELIDKKEGENVDKTESSIDDPPLPPPAKKTKDKPSERGKHYKICMEKHTLYDEKALDWFEMTPEYKKKFDDLYKEALEHGVIRDGKKKENTKEEIKKKETEKAKTA